MSASYLGLDVRVSGTLAYRELLKLRRESARFFAMLAQPLLIWLVFSLGFDGGFGEVFAGGQSFREYFFPGVVVMTLLFATIFSSMSIIDDRAGGFLQGALMAPASRLSLVVGKCLGIMFVTGLQVGCVVFAGWFMVTGAADWDLLQLVIWFAASSFALIPLNLAAALWLNSSQSYHAFMGAILLPAWVLSGSLFPVSEGPFHYVAMLNPMTYMVHGFRIAMQGFGAQPSVTLSPYGCLAVLFILGCIGCLLAVKTLDRSMGRR
jgi:ABC-2 type transport system permease protein